VQTIAKVNSESRVTICTAYDRFETDGALKCIHECTVHRGCQHVTKVRKMHQERSRNSLMKCSGVAKNGVICLLQPVSLSNRITHQVARNISFAIFYIRRRHKNELNETLLNL
jgi:hypothetical protein